MTIYSGSSILKTDFNMYPSEDMAVESFDEILEGFKDTCLPDIVKRLSEIGIKFNEVEYYHPKYYNYEGDDLDFDLTITDKEVLIKAVLSKGGDIKTELDKNKSYDGYWARTCKTIEEVIDNINKKDEVDVLALQVLINFDSGDFDKFDYIIYEEGEDDC